jgi:hypothetical protein
MKERSSERRGEQTQKQTQRETETAPSCRVAQQEAVSVSA